MQDLQAFGVGLLYAVTLSTTRDIMQALQQAHQCRQGVISGQSPTRQASDCLPDLPRTEESLRISLHPSPNSKLCGVVYGGDWSFATEDQNSKPSVCGLALYETHTGKLLHSLRTRDPEPCSVSWSSCGTRIYAQVETLDATINLNLMIEVYDAASGRIVTPHWDPQTAAVMSQVQWISGCTWAPDGEHLLVCCDESRGNGMDRSLHVLHAATGGLLATVPLTRVGCISYCTVRAFPAVPFLWHPSSRAFAVPACSYELSTADIWRAAQLKSGHCPALVHMLPHLTFFSPDGRYLLAPAFAGEGEAIEERVAVMQCIEHAECFSFPLLHILGDLQSPVLSGRWCPRANAPPALLVVPPKGLRLLTLDGQRLYKPAPAKMRQRYPAMFSPCGRFCQLFRQIGDQSVPHIVHWEDGTVHRVPGSRSDVEQTCNGPRVAPALCSRTLIMTCLRGVTSSPSRCCDMVHAEIRGHRLNMTCNVLT